MLKTLDQFRAFVPWQDKAALKTGKVGQLYLDLPEKSREFSL